MPLRIAYSFFLLDRMKNPTTALFELDIAYKLNPKFDEEFLIYRHRRIINEQKENSHKGGGDHKGGLDVVGVIAFDNSKKQCIEFIRQSSHYHKDFWLELLDDSPSKNFSMKTWTS